MNIAFVNATHRWGGVKTWTLEFGESLAARGHGVFVYGRQGVFTEAARRRIGHGERVKFGPDLNPFAIRRFRRTFRDHAIDAVFVNIEKDLATAGAAARVLGIPVIQRIGLPGDIPRRLKTEWLHRWINPYFLSPCAFIEQGFLKSLPYLDPARSHVILNARRPDPSPIEIHVPRRLVATQQLFADKEHATLLRALAGIRLPYEVHIAGTGNLETPLKNLAHDLGMADRVVWHGFVDNVPELLRTCDIFLLASRSEGLPNTLQEALTVGLLPICRDVGGVREVISESLAPWILSHDADEHAFRAALERALSLPDATLASLRREARETRTRFFDLETKTTEMETWLQQVIAENKTTPVP